MTTTHRTIDTTIGGLTLVAEHDVLKGVWFPDHRTRPDRRTFGVPSATCGQEAERQLVAYLAGERTSFTVPTLRRGTAFQQRVWAVLDAIPYGATTTYGAIARELGDPGLARMVGHAVGHNPLSVVVPCHRVVGHDGALTGYAGGLERKRRLLDLEAGPGSAYDEDRGASALTLF